MSVLQRGGSFIHHRLSKLYSDTKQSYETATVTSRIEVNPDVVSLQREYRTQKDRLLAWGLDWSDSDTAQFPEVQIDDSVDEAGYGDVVACIMSTIQDLLMQSEKLQTSLTEPASEPNRRPPGSFDDSTIEEQPKTPSSLSPEQFERSQSLLSELTACIDYLFKLSDARRAKRKGSRDHTVSKDSFIKNLESLRRRPSFETEISERTLINSGPTVMDTTPTRVRPQSAVSRSPINDAQPPTSSAPPQLTLETKARICAEILKVNEAAIFMHSNSALDEVNPPTYDAAVGASISRSLGHIIASELNDEDRTRLACSEEEIVPILIETTPIQPWNEAVPTEQQLGSLQSLHTGKDLACQLATDNLPRLIGYATENLQHIVVYRMPNTILAKADASPIKVEALNTLFSVGSDSSDSHMPSLEERFRLAFNLAVALLQFQKANLHHGSINSSNVILFHNRGTKSAKFRSPMLMSQISFLFKSSEDVADESFPTKIYRHPREKELIGGPVSWASDSYSLGLILLEIGLWTPLRRLWKPKYDAETFRSRIRSVYSLKLASRCGSAYMKAVQACLDAPEDPTIEGASMPVGYMVKVLSILARCCAIDLDGPPVAHILDIFRELAVQERELVAKAQTSVQHNELKNDTNSEAAAVQPTVAPQNDVQTSDAAPETTPKAKVVLRKWDTIDIPQADLDLWNTYLMPRLSKLLNSVLGHSSESCSASLMMIGATPDTAKTTICVQCHSVDVVRKALKKNFKCKSGWGLVVLRGDIQRSNHRRSQVAKDETEAIPAAPESTQEVDSCYQHRPSGGASIGAYRDYEHLPPVSFGGSIVIRGELYGMTVHHMLDAPTEDEESGHQAVHRSAATAHAVMEDLSYIGDGPDLSYDAYSLELTDDEAIDLADSDDEQDDFWFSEVAELTDDDGEDEFDADDDDNSSVGDIEGINPLEADEDLIVTQPAIDDVEEDFFPSPEDRDDDHLASHTLGYVHASSGIRRVMRRGIKHEVDWALIKINTDRLPSKNTFICNEGYDDSTTPSIITQVAPLHSLPSTRVLCSARTSGLQSGRISPALALVKMHGRHSFSSSYCVDGGFGVPGDSGAWVFDPVKGALCGHVLAWGNRAKVAYIAPMEVLFEDIERKVGGRVTLPDAEAELRINAGEVTKADDTIAVAEVVAGLSEIGLEGTLSTPTAIPDAQPQMGRNLSTQNQRQTHRSQQIPAIPRALPKLQVSTTLPLMMH